MFEIALFGIKNDGVNLALSLLIFFLAVIWLSLVYFTFADARRRIDDPVLIGCAVAASLFPFVGTIVYLIVRPPEYLDDVHERELEIRAAEARLEALAEERCPNCEVLVDREFLRCPDCGQKLRDPCAGCGKPLAREWDTCPYCETPVGTQPRAQRKKTSKAAARRVAEATGQARRARLPGATPGSSGEQGVAAPGRTAGAHGVESEHNGTTGAAAGEATQPAEAALPVQSHDDIEAAAVGSDPASTSSFEGSAADAPPAQ